MFHNWNIFFKKTSGITAVQYALLLGLIGVFSIFVITALGIDIKRIFGLIADRITQETPEIDGAPTVTLASNTYNVTLPPSASIIDDLGGTGYDVGSPDGSLDIVITLADENSSAAQLTLELGLTSATISPLPTFSVSGTDLIRTATITATPATVPGDEAILTVTVTDETGQKNTATALITFSSFINTDYIAALEEPSISAEVGITTSFTALLEPDLFTETAVTTTPLNDFNEGDVTNDIFYDDGGTITDDGDTVGDPDGDVTNGNVTLTISCSADGGEVNFVDNFSVSVSSSSIFFHTFTASTGRTGNVQLIVAEDVNGDLFVQEFKAGTADNNFREHMCFDSSLGLCAPIASEGNLPNCSSPIACRITNSHTGSVTYYIPAADEANATTGVVSSLYATDAGQRTNRINDNACLSAGDFTAINTSNGNTGDAQRPCYSWQSTCQ